MTAHHTIHVYQAGLGTADGTLSLTAALIAALIIAVIVLIALRRSRTSRPD